MPFGTTSDANLTRDQLVSYAYKTIGVLAEGESLTAQSHDEAVDLLNSIVREIDSFGKWLWAIPNTPSSLTIVANTWVYTSANGLPTNILELVKATYRDAQAQDWPLDIYTTERYEAITNKLDVGDPKAVFIPENITVSSKTMYIWPARSTVNTQSVVTGTDSNAYKCIRSHTADSTNRPITGANYLQFWAVGGTGPSTWVTGTAYTSPHQIRLWYKRPLFDFDDAKDNPDFPQQWNRYLIYRLAYDLADSNSLDLNERQLLNAKAQQAYETIFRTIRPTTTAYRDKAQYY